MHLQRDVCRNAVSVREVPCGNKSTRSLVQREISVPMILWERCPGQSDLSEAGHHPSLVPWRDSSGVEFVLLEDPAGRGMSVKSFPCACPSASSEFCALAPSARL